MPKPVGLQYTARLGSLAADTLVVVDFELTECLSRLFHLTLNLASTCADLSASDLLDQDAELRIYQDGALLRQVHGVVSGFARGDSGHRRTRYQVTVQPALWRLQLMHNSRIFQHQSSQAILQTLLEERRIATTQFDLMRPPAEREYCVQHRESDYDFLTRLAAEEGWHYRFEQSGGHHTLVISDHHRDAPRLAEATYNANAGGSHREPCIYRFQYREQVAVTGVALKDYTFRNPAYALMHERQASARPGQTAARPGHNPARPGHSPARPEPVEGPVEGQIRTQLGFDRLSPNGGENRSRNGGEGSSPNGADQYQHYDYPGRFKTDASGQSFTQARLDALRADSSRAKGQSNRPDFTPGAKVPMTGHSHDAHNDDWLITQVTHTGSQPQALEEEGGSGATTYHNEFSAIPAHRPWRPQVKHRPLMDGPQIAIVTGPEGEEIHCDEHGRVKVRFPWDRYSKNDEHSSAWLRVSQGWAGGQYGFMALPRIGHEVIVSFLDGDPDQPIITGRTYHATNTPPYSLPEHKTRTTLKTQTHKGEGSNELRFEDEAGKEQVYVHAQKDLDLLTENDRTEVIKRDSHLTVDRHRIGHIKGNDHSTVDGEKRESVGGDRSLKVGGTHHSKQGKAQLVEAGREIHHKAGLKIVIEAGAEVTLKAGGSFVKVDPSGVTVSGPMVKMNSGGSPGNGADIAVQTPLSPELVEAGEKVSTAEAALADTGTRANASGPTPAVSSGSQTASRSALLREAAQQGALTISECEYDEHGRCTLHQHP